MGRRFPLTVFLFVSALTTQSFAKSLSEPALYNRCYASITGHPVPRASNVMAQIRAGQTTALAACDALIDSVNLDATNGQLQANNATEGQWILNNFYTFHRSWFPTTAIEQIQAYGEENSPATRDLYDATEPSLQVTRSMFATGAKYSDIVTAPTGVIALRRDDKSLNRGWTVTFPSRFMNGNSAVLDANVINFREMSGPGWDRNSNTTQSEFQTMDKIQTGELIGIAPKVKVQNVPNVSLNLIGELPDRRGNDQPGMNYAFDMNRNFGGGVLGMPIFLMLNFGHGVGLEMNGSVKLPRRWAKTVMNTFMCANLPNLRPSDAEQFLAINSTAPFRNAVSCLQCHASMDQMAGVARNLVMVNSDVYPTNMGNDPVKSTARTSLMIASYRADLPAASGWPSEPVKDFFRQMPTGRFYMRSVSGALIDRPVSSIGDVGHVIAETDDYYQCAAKRYFEFMTGISAPLYDRTNPVNQSLNMALTADDIKDRKFIEDLGAKLRATQSVKALIKDIMASAYFRSSNFRP